jgi:hypothetical protein
MPSKRESPLQFDVPLAATPSGLGLPQDRIDGLTLFERRLICGHVNIQFGLLSSTKLPVELCRADACVGLGRGKPRPYKACLVAAMGRAVPLVFIFLSCHRDFSSRTEWLCALRGQKSFNTEVTEILCALCVKA